MSFAEYAETWLRKRSLDESTRDCTEFRELTRRAKDDLFDEENNDLDEAA